MIQVHYSLKERYICVEGHAGSGPEGHDLVCAAVSALTYALEATCALHPEYHAEVKRFISVAHFYCCLNRRGRKALWTVVDGLKLIAEKYPEYIKIEERR